MERDFSDMEKELTTEKEDERGQNKPQNAANERSLNIDQTAANSNQAVENGERELSASRQSRCGRQIRPRLRAWSHCGRFFDYDRSRSQRTRSQKPAARSHYIFWFSLKRTRCSCSLYLKVLRVPFCLTFFLVDHPLLRVRCPFFSLSLSLSRSPLLSPSGSLLLSLTGSGSRSLRLAVSHSPDAYTGGVSPLPMNPLEVSSFVSKPTACALTACEHVFAIDHGRVSSACDVYSTFKDLIIAERARRVARGGEFLTALSRRGQGGSFRCKTVSTASVRKGAMTRRRASTATLFSQQNEERQVQSHRFSDRLAYGEGISDSKIDQHRRRSMSARCWAAADRSPAADIVLELMSIDLLRTWATSVWQGIISG